MTLPDMDAVTASYLTAADVALMLRVSEKSIYRWAIQDPTMPALKVGGTVRFPAERLAKWLRDREQGAGRQRTNSQVRSLPKSTSERRLP